MSYSHRQPAEIPANEDAEFSQKNKALLRYFYPGDLINVHALTEELIAQNEIISIEDDTQVLCMTAFHLAKLAQQQPKIHRALRPLYNVEGYLVSGLPMPVWQQMAKYHRRILATLANNGYNADPCCAATIAGLTASSHPFSWGVMNIWQFSQLHWEAIPFFQRYSGSVLPADPGLCRDAALPLRIHTETQPIAYHGAKPIGSQQ